MMDTYTYMNCCSLPLPYPLILSVPSSLSLSLPLFLVPSFLSLFLSLSRSLSRSLSVPLVYAHTHTHSLSLSPPSALSVYRAHARSPSLHIMSLFRPLLLSRSRALSPFLPTPPVPLFRPPSLFLSFSLSLSPFALPLPPPHPLPLSLARAQCFSLFSLLLLLLLCLPRTHTPARSFSLSHACTPDLALSSISTDHTYEIVQHIRQNIPHSGASSSNCSNKKLCPNILMCIHV